MLLFSHDFSSLYRTGLFQKKNSKGRHCTRIPQTENNFQQLVGIVFFVIVTSCFAQCFVLFFFSSAPPQLLLQLCPSRIATEIPCLRMHWCCLPDRSCLILEETERAYVSIRHSIAAS